MSTTPGGVALAWAVEEWGRCIRSPHGRDPRDSVAVDGYIRGPLGLGWPSAQVAGKGPVAFGPGSRFQWCGAFAARAWGAAGLAAEVRRLRYPSTYRLGSTEAKHGPPLLRVPSTDLRPGDVLVVTDGSKAWGSHVCLVMYTLGALIYTVEGNARGKLGDGTVGAGVIMRTRPHFQTRGVCPVSGLPQSMWAHAAYRPTAEMLTEVPE
jgi:hypothetical protein